MNSTNPAPFDAYTKWLDIPAGKRPPDYYVLLGVETTESDRAAIRQAADERTKVVRPRCLKYRELATRLLNEIAKARVCLTDPDRRAAYDESLRQEATRGRKTAGIDPSTFALRAKSALRGHKASVSCLAFDPQGLLLASAGHDGTTRIWNLNAGRLRAMLNDNADYKSKAKALTRGASAPLTQAAFSPDGAFFATAGEDTTAKLWDVTNGKLRQVLEKAEAASGRIVTALAFQPNAPILAVGYKQKRVQVWNVDEGKFLRNVACPTKDLAFSPDGLTLVTSRCFWDFDAGTQEAQFDRDEGSANCLMFSPDGSFLVTGTATGVHFWEAATGAHRMTFRQRPANVKSVAFSADGSILAAGLVGGIVELWDVSKRRFLFELKAHMRVVQSIAFSPDSHWLATGGDDAQVKVWEISANAGGGPASVPGDRERQPVPITPPQRPPAEALVTEDDDDDFKLRAPVERPKTGHLEQDELLQKHEHTPRSESGASTIEGRAAPSPARAPGPASTPVSRQSPASDKQTTSEVVDPDRPRDVRTLALVTVQRVDRLLQAVAGEENKLAHNVLRMALAAIPALIALVLVFMIVSQLKGKSVATDSIGMKLAPIPAGEFMMGSPEAEADRGGDKHRHSVRITKPFYLGVYEVPQGEYERVMGGNPSFVKEAIDKRGGVTGTYRSLNPVEQVTRVNALEFCRRLSELPEEKKTSRVYRLPTQAE